MTYQVAVTTDLLVAGRAEPPNFPRVAKVVPEGFEDVDCVLRDDRRLLVQTKERGPGANAIGAADLASALVHAAEAFRSEGNELDTNARFAFVTDGILSPGVPQTGWNRSVAQALADSGDEGDRRLQALIDLVAKRLREAGQPEALVEPLIEMASVIRRPWHLRLETEQVMRDRLALHPSVATLTYDRLAIDLSHVAAEQRSRQRTDADFRTTGDLDALMRRVQESVNVEALEKAVREGLVEPVDYTVRSSMTEGEFLEGVDVTPAHVAARLDVLRVDELSAILGGLATRGQVVIAGPSGSGKSALMWRAARDVGRGARPVRVLRCSTEADVTLVVRHARLQQPSPGSQLLICADDLGRDAFTKWETARDQLLAIPGVLLLATVRREDFTAQLAGDATVVDPKLSQSSADAVYDRLKTAGVSLALEPEEAATRAEGLLMEFITLATTGKRLEAVLAVQVERLAQPGRRLQRRCLRLITAAHTLGSALSSEALACNLTRDGRADVDDVGDALGVLADEHLLRPDADGSWRGLHDLRSEVLLRLLHSTPPPTLVSTFAEVLPLLPPGRRAFAMQRAAERFARAAVVDLGVGGPHEIIDHVSALFSPIADAAGVILEHLPADPGGAQQATDLLDGALRADAAIYANACIHFLKAQRTSTDLQSLAFTTFAIRNAGIRMPDALPAGRSLNALGMELPGGSTALRQALGARVSSQRLAELAEACSLTQAVQLLEAAEGAVSLTPRDAAAIWAQHIPSLPDPPGDQFDQLAADGRARLTATLAALAGLRGPDVVDVLGPVDARAADAVATEPYGLTVSVALAGHDPSEDLDSPLIRRETFATGQLLVGHVRRLAEPEDAPIPSAYPPLATQKGDGSINDQAVHLARRLFDACPELDRVDIHVIQPNLELRRYTTSYGVHEEGSKRLRRGILLREPETRFNAASLAAVARSIAAENWSERLRQQATVAAELVSLLQTCILHLRTYRNARLLRLYLERAERTEAAVTRLPSRPTDRIIENWTDAVEAGVLDERARTSDRARASLGQLAGAIVQLARGLLEDESAAVNGAAYRLLDVPKELEIARREGAPTYAGIGDTLPRRLDELASLVADVVISREVSPAARSMLDRVKPSDDLPQLASEVAATAAREQADLDRHVVRNWLAERQVPASDYMMSDREPLAGRLGSSQILAIVPLENWSDAVQLLQEWPPDERQDLTGAAVAMPVDAGRLLPIALRVFGSLGSVLPVTDSDVHADAAAASGLPLADAPPLSAVIARTVDELFAVSRERVRDARREHSWERPPRQSTDPAKIASRLKQDYADQLAKYRVGEDAPTGLAVSMLLELCAAVADEDGHEEGFAAAIASVDVARIGATANPYLELLDAVVAVGMLSGTA